MSINKWIHFPMVSGKQDVCSISDANKRGGGSKKDTGGSKYSVLVAI